MEDLEERTYPRPAGEDREGEGDPRNLHLVTLQDNRLFRKRFFPIVRGTLYPLSGPFKELLRLLSKELDRLKRLISGFIPEL